MKNTAILLLVLLTWVVFTSCGEKGSEVTIIEREIRREKPNGSIPEMIDCKYPQVTGLKDVKVQSRINTLIYSKAFEHERRALVDMSLEKNHRGKSLRYLSEYKITNNLNKNLVSIRFNESAFISGSAHPNDEIKSITIDLRDGKVYRLKDLFTENSDYRSRMDKFIHEEIQKKGLQLLKGFEGIEEEQDFYITDEEIVVYYQEYVYTPHSYGALVFSIPRSLVSDIIKPVI